MKLSIVFKSTLKGLIFGVLAIAVSLFSLNGMDQDALTQHEVVKTPQEAQADQIKKDNEAMQQKVATILSPEAKQDSEAMRFGVLIERIKKLPHYVIVDEVLAKMDSKDITKLQKAALAGLNQSTREGLKEAMKSGYKRMYAFVEGIKDEAMRARANEYIAIKKAIDDYKDKYTVQMTRVSLFSGNTEQQKKDYILPWLELSTLDQFKTGLIDSFVFDPYKFDKILVLGNFKKDWDSEGAVGVLFELDKHGELGEYSTQVLYNRSINDKRSQLQYLHYINPNRLVFLDTSTHKLFYLDKKESGWLAQPVEISHVVQNEGSEIKHNLNVRQIYASNNSSILALCTIDNYLVFVDASKNPQERDYKIYADDGQGLGSLGAFSPDNTLFAVSSRKGSIKVYEVATGKIVMNIEQERYPDALRYDNTTGDLVVHRGASIEVYDGRSYELKKEVTLENLDENRANIILSAISPDARTVAFVPGNFHETTDSVALYDVKTGKQYWEYKIKSIVSFLGFSKDSMQLAASLSRNEMVIWKKGTVSGWQWGDIPILANQE